MMNIKIDSKINRIKIADQENRKPVLQRNGTGFEIVFVSDNCKASIIDAQKILGKNLLGPEQVKKAFDIEISSQQVPSIALSEEELEMIKKNNKHLELQIPDLTMKDLQNKIKEKADTEIMKRTGGLAFVGDGVQTKYLNKQKTTLQWKVVSNKQLKETYRQTAPIQLKTMIGMLEQMYKGNIPKRYQQPIKDFKEELPRKIAEVTSLTEEEIKTKTSTEIDQVIHDQMDMGSIENKEKLVNWLSDSKIVQAITPTVTDAFYTFALRYLNVTTPEERKQLQSDYYGCSRIYQSSSAGCFASFGGFGFFDGISACSWGPERLDDCYGALFSFGG